MEKKLNSVLQKGAEEEDRFNKEQDKLKDRLGIKGKNVVIVEKSNTLKFTVNTFIKLIKTLLSVAVIALAFTGITALVYPAPREEVIHIFTDALLQIKEMLPEGIL